MRPIGEQTAFTEGHMDGLPPGVGGFTKREAVFLQVYTTLLGVISMPIGNAAPDPNRAHATYVRKIAAQHTHEILTYMETNAR